MFRFRYLFFLLIFPIFVFPAGAQFHMDYSVEANVVAGGGDYTPYYLMNKRGGMVSFNPNNGYLRAAVQKAADTARVFTYGFGLDVSAAYNNDIPAYVQQAYVELRLYCLALTAGSREEGSLLWNDALSSGGWVWSGNSRPVPQVRIGIPEFVNFPWTHGVMQIRGEIAYGRFDDDKYQRHTHGDGMQYSRGLLYHRKYLMLRFGKNTQKVYGTIGIDMAAQFGGTVYNADGTVAYDFPSSAIDYLKVFVPKSGGENSPERDQVNITGNHVGSYLMEVGLRQKTWEGRIYYEHPFDDHSGMIFHNRCDGLWGVEYRSKAPCPAVKGVVVEYLNTKNQSGPFLWDKTDKIPVQVSAGDYYYGHRAYNGWTHWGHTIGNPLVASPGYNADSYLGFASSRVEALHIGLDGYIVPQFDYRLLLSIQRGWGNPYAPFTDVRKEFSGMLEVNYRPRQLGGWRFGAGIAVDAGTMFRNNWGIQFGVTKSGRLF